MTIKTVKRLAGSIFGCGISRVKIADDKEAATAITRDDVRGLIAAGVVYSIPAKGVGRGKAKFKQSRVQAGRRRGRGSKKGAPSISDKERWMAKVRSQRALLKSFKGKLPMDVYRRAYRMVKGANFKSKKQLLAFMQANMKG
ncbi:50S ribosomal protein L19e [Candidatus Micrarchaeota archaeon]|nr:50S ribosomal protein L19e [Candidatus Micrarchaeota archaeon]